jgi:hypothetical protein
MNDFTFFIAEKVRFYKIAHQMFAGSKVLPLPAFLVNRALIQHPQAVKVGLNQQTSPVKC